MLCCAVCTLLADMLNHGTGLKCVGHMSLSRTALQSKEESSVQFVADQYLQPGEQVLGAAQTEGD